MKILRSVGQTLVLGIAAGVAAGVVLSKPDGRPALRSLVKGTMKFGIRALAKSRERLAETREALEDLAAEAHNELAADESQIPPGDGPGVEHH
jgi:hypothetical protein